MDRHLAIKGLESPRTIERLRAARALSRGAEPEDLEVLNQARKRETDALVRNVLRRAISRLTQTDADLENGLAAPQHIDPDLAEVYAEAYEDTVRMVLHELRPLVGDLEYNADREVESYEASWTKHDVGRLKSFLIALDRLRAASAVPAIREFDLSRLISEIGTSAGFSDAIVLGREDPVIVRGDPDLLSLAIANGIRNAVEATALSDGSGQRVIVNWGSTDTDAWVSILDEGPGLPLSAERAYEAGVTTKSKAEHDGMGLTIAKRAMTSLEGSIDLRPRDISGAACEIRWPTIELHADEDSPD